jgi:DNA-binding NtrC family response regulator
MSDALGPKRSPTNRDRVGRKAPKSKKMTAARQTSKSAPPPRPLATPRSTSLPPSRAQVLVIDDDPRLVHLMSDSLSSSGFQVIVRSEVPRNSQWLVDNHVDFVLVSATIPAVADVDLSALLQKVGLTKKVSVVLYSKHAGSELGPLARRTGALGVLEKINDTKSFLSEFEALVARHFQMQEDDAAPKNSEKSAE